MASLEIILMLSACTRLVTAITAITAMFTNLRRLTPRPTSDGYDLTEAADRRSGHNDLWARSSGLLEAIDHLAKHAIHIVLGRLVDKPDEIAAHDLIRCPCNSR